MGVMSEYGSPAMRSAAGRACKGAAAVVFLGALFAVTVSARGDWRTFGHDRGGSRYSTLKQIDSRNVTKLVRAWTYHMSAAAAPAPAPAAGSSEAGDAVEGGRGRGDRECGVEGKS